jgi:hypothetical protein
MAWEYHPVDLGFFHTAPCKFVNTELVRRPPDRIFAAIAEDAPGWGDWNPGFSKTGRYLSPPPHGPGSQRVVRMSGITYDETILAWNPPERWAFRVDKAAAPIAHALAEDYRITPVDGGSIVQWTFAADPRSALRVATPLLAPTLTALFRRAMSNLEKKI